MCRPLHLGVILGVKDQVDTKVWVPAAAITLDLAVHVPLC